jgi:hypothetical protein
LVPPLPSRDDRCDNRYRREHHQCRDCCGAESAEPALLAQIITSQLILGLAMNRRRQRRDLLPQRRRMRIPRRIRTDINKKRLNRQHPRLGQHRHRRIRDLPIKTPPRRIPHQPPTSQHQQQTLTTPPAQPITDLLIHPIRLSHTRR